MYEGHFDEEAALDAEDVIERAYALGVASVCGDPDQEAVYRRLKTQAPDSYDESLVELAYEEGRARALELESDVDEPTEVWATLVETKLRDVDVDAVDGATGLPDALTRSDDALPSRRPENLDLPSFLEK